ncbi:MAG: DNA-directed RNA polymerase subunit beta' [Bryobacter sp.]|jgi:DNA-directed RNA polymerase subunit beta'|nr:DNA-directed RNA polymerase subunit beta' [Bryobacter sp. CoA8 C33]
MYRSNPYDRGNLIADFDSIRISLASPEKIINWSHGEVTKPETINYRTFKPERDGLFCARIFGPVADWECLCGKYKRMKHRGVICDKCGVEVTLSRVRRERLGHIELASPCSHVWFFKGLPSRIGYLLDITLRELERVLYFEAYVIVEPGDATGQVHRGEVISDERKRQLDLDFPGGFVAMMGAEGIKELLKKIDVDTLSVEIRERMKTEQSAQKKLKFAKRLRVTESFRKSGNKPEWMILDVLPVIPPDLRPLVPLDGGRFATSDLNDLYRRVINRNNRLKKLIELHAPDVIVRNEKRMLQEAVDALFDNGRRGRVLRGANNRPLKSLSDTLKGKQGRFRQNLLGKRVDYSGRSVIVVGPELKLHQCGLPKKMALELFKPFIYHRLEQRGHCTTIKQAKELVEQQDPVVWDILEEVIKDHPILLNRAPTLHRLGIQAFEPVLVEGKALKLHPLVCTAFNADFDGDQMAVHIPLSPEAQIEASTLMLASNNILSPAHGAPIATPTQDMVLGLYYLTKLRPGTKGEGRTFASVDDVLIALEMGEVETLTPIRLRYTGKVIDLTKAFDSQNVMHTEPVEYDKQYMDTTVGRVILNDVLQRAIAPLTTEPIAYINGLLKKKGLTQMVHHCYLKFGLTATVAMLDDVKALGFHYATRGGVSIGIDDMVVPSVKPKLVAEAEKQVIEVQQQYNDGAITNGERYNKTIEIWQRANDQVSDAMFKLMEEDDRTGRYLNPIYIMADSGARGSKQQIRQLSGMRGLMAKPNGEIIETPITANFREGLNVLQYFISTHGARKGLADTALKTADSGYLTRRLCDVAQDVIITELDCGTDEGIYVEPIIEAGEIIEPLRDRIIGRVAQEDQQDFEGRTIVSANEEITEEKAAAIQAAGIERVKIRSVLTCESKRGVCQLCYGRNLATGRMVERGEAVGIISAQSIGEPGTQLTMRTFHVGGTASSQSEQSTQDAKTDGYVKYDGIQVVKDKVGQMISMNRSGILVIVDEKGREKERYPVVYGAKVLLEDGAPVKQNQVVLEWDPYAFSILTEVSGVVHFKDMVDGVTMNEQVDEITGMSQFVVIDSTDDKKIPAVIIRPAGGHKSDERRYLMPTHAHMLVREGEEVHAGDVLAKLPRATTKTKDITGGLPRVVELFEARKPHDPAIIAEISGTIRFGELVKGYRKISITGDDGTVKEYSIPRGVHINFQEGERIKAGDPLMDGPRNPHDILAVLGETELQKYMVNEIQEVYRLQGVNINDKHLEVIVRQMLRWVKIDEIGDTEFLPEEVVDRFKFKEENTRAIESAGRPARGNPILLGITKASLSTDSFISAASFQETTRVLTEAAINGKVDYLRGLKENVIMGRLIPAGTGMEYYRRAKIAGEDVVDSVEQEPENIMDSLSAYDDDAKSLFAGGLDDDGDLGMGDVE